MVVQDYRDNKLSIFDGLVVHEIEYKEPKRKDKFFPCECGSELLRVSKFDDEDLVYLSVYSFSAEKYTLLERIKILFGGKVKTTEIILSGENFNKLKKF
jgi:hypothetical protein